MIKEMSLSCFRKVVDSHMVFTKGLNVLRSANEGTKTTRLEAITFALYGTRALRTPLEDAVTWGYPVSKLKVVLTICIDGVDYTYTRSKAGAEVTRDGKLFATGQTEVTALSAQLLGADAKTAASLMLADQSGLRGALDDGPAAVSGLMSKLADFDLIDRIIAEMQDSLLLGSDAPVLEKLRVATEELAAANASMPAPEDVTAAENEVTDIGGRAAALLSHRKHETLPAYEAALAALNTAKEDARAREKAESDVALVQQRLDKIVSSLSEARPLVVPVDIGKIAALRSEIADTAESARRFVAYQEFKGLPKCLPHWDGDRASFDAALKTHSELLSSLRSKLSALNAGIAALERQIIVGGVCRSCGTDVSKRDDINEKNATLNADIAKLKEEEGETLQCLQIVQNELAYLGEIDLEDQRWRRLITPTLAPYVTLNWRTVPSPAAWNGPTPRRDSMFYNLEKTRAELAALEKQAEDSSKAEGAVEVLEKALEDVRLEHAFACTKLYNTPDVDVAPYGVALNDAASALGRADEVIRKTEEAYDVAISKMNALYSAVTNANASIANAEFRIAEYRKDIQALGFNNALLKKMRAIKPGVTDYLWSSVLAAVSQFFTQLRGEASVVTKDGDGFKVNGSTVKSLSGSTLDVLALAIRVALTKTFIPTSSFLALDEPGAGCDSARMASLLGFLASVGFQQVLLASHDDLSESVADNVISLGG